MADDTDYTRTFIGARYVPKFEDYSASSVYEPLTMVVVNDNIYISKQFVPAGVAVSNTEYWSMMPAFDTNSQTAITNAVNAWLDNHPEATTTVQDGAITTAKLANGAVTNAKLSQDSGILQSEYLNSHKAGFYTSSFSVNANIGHSSNADKIKVDIKTGQTFSALITINIETSDTYQLWATYSDGTSGAILTWYFDRPHDVTATKDIVYLGISIAQKPSAYVCDMVIELADSIFNNVQTIEDNLESSTGEISNKIDRINRSTYLSGNEIGVFTNSFSVDANTGHSANIDTMDVDIKSGETFSVLVNIDITTTDTYQVYATYSDGTTGVILTWRFGNEYNVTASNNIVKLGVAIGQKSEPYTCDIIINGGNSIPDRMQSVEDNTEYDRIIINTLSDDLNAEMSSFISNGNAHSANDDRMNVNISQNETFAVTVNLDIDSNETYQMWASYSDGTSERILTYYFGREYTLLAKKDITNLGVTIGAKPEPYRCVIVIKRINSINYFNQNINNWVIQAKRTINLTQNQYKRENQPLVLMHFSDIHGDDEVLRRIVAYKSHFGNNVDDVICTGDMVTDRYNDGMSFWDSVSGSESILMVIGNHDVLAGESGYDWSNLVPQSTQYNTYMAPYIENWGCTYTSGLTYYYKDYTAKNIRLICLNCMLTGDDANAQATWLESRLTEANTIGYYVIIAIHYPAPHSTNIDCNFTSLDLEPTNSFSVAYMSKVNDFITNGGKFACYITGHTHFDKILKATEYNNQLCIVIDAAGLEVANAWSDTQRARATRYWDCINLFVLDTASGVIKIIRAGANMDHYLRAKNCITIKLSDKTIITQN